MKTTILIIFTLGLAVGSFAYPPRQSNRNRKSHSPQVIPSNVSANEVKILLTTIAENQHLNEVFSDVIGVNITALNNEIKLLITKSLEVRNARREKLEALIEKTSLSFRMNVILLAQKFKIRLFSLLMKGVEADSASTAAITQAFNTLCRRLISLVRTPDEVKREDVVKIFETFMNTKLKSTIREELEDAKLFVGVYLLLDEATEAFMTLAKQEGPEVQADLKSIYTEVEETSRELVKPLLDLLKPAFLPEYEPLLPNYSSTALPSTTERLSEFEDSEDNEIWS